MRYDRQRWGWAGVFLGTLVLLTGCAYDATVRQPSLAEQGEWHLYKKVMTPAQARAYVAKASAAERTAYLREVGPWRALSRHSIRSTVRWRGGAEWLPARGDECRSAPVCVG